MLLKYTMDILSIINVLKTNSGMLFYQKKVIKTVHPPSGGASY